MPELGQELRNIKLRLQEQALRDAADRERRSKATQASAIGQMTSSMLPVIPHELKHIRDELDRNQSHPAPPEDTGGTGIACRT